MELSEDFIEEKCEKIVKQGHFWEKVKTLSIFPPAPDTHAMNFMQLKLTWDTLLSLFDTTGHHCSAITLKHARLSCYYCHGSYIKTRPYCSVSPPRGRLDHHHRPTMAEWSSPLLPPLLTPSIIKYQTHIYPTWPTSRDQHLTKPHTLAVDSVINQILHAYWTPNIAHCSPPFWIYCVIDKITWPELNTQRHLPWTNNITFIMKGGRHLSSVTSEFMFGGVFLDYRSEFRWLTSIRTDLVHPYSIEGARHRFIWPGCRHYW